MHLPRRRENAFDACRRRSWLREVLLTIFARVGFSLSFHKCSIGSRMFCFVSYPLHLTQYVLSDHVAARHLLWTRADDLPYLIRLCAPFAGSKCSDVRRPLVALALRRQGLGRRWRRLILRHSSELCASALVGDSDGEAVRARAPGLQNQKRKGITFGS